MKKYISTVDIAKALNLSPSTVSRALNDNYTISEKTRKKVQAYAQKVGYQKNFHASSLIQKQTNLIGLVIPSTSGYFLRKLVKGITEELYKNNYELIIMQSNEDSERELRNISFLRSIRVDGMIYSPAHTTNSFAHVEEVVKSQVPIVNFDRGINLDCSHVLCDDQHGAFSAVQHLIDIGSKRIVHLGGPENAQNANDRFEGYKRALLANNMELNMDFVFRKDFNVLHSSALIEQIFQLDPLPDAIFAANDGLAIGCIAEAQKRGLQIPDEIAFVGYDDDTFCRFTTPPLSSVQNPIFEMGNETASMCLDQISRSEVAYQSKVLLPKLIIRESSRKGKVLHYA